MPMRRARKFCAQCGAKLGAAPAPAPSPAPARVTGASGSARCPRRRLPPSGASSPSCSAIWSARPRCPPGSIRKTCARSSPPITNAPPRSSRGFGGYVAKYMGDGVLIYFGYPEAHEADAENAVRAALALIEAVDAAVCRGRPSDPHRHRHRPGRGRRTGRRRRSAGAQRRRRDAEPRRAAAIGRGAEHGRDRRHHAAAGRRPVRL